LTTATTTSSDVESSESDRFGTLTGPLVTVDPKAPYQVQYGKLGGRLSRCRIVALATANVTLEVVFIIWLTSRSHFPRFDGSVVMCAANVFVAASITVTELLRLVNVVAVSGCSLLARDPIPVYPDDRLRVAFITTMVPGKEPVDVVEKTLRAAKQIEYPGRLDVWLLAETRVAEVQEMCTRLGVRHFSRDGKSVWNQPAGAFKAKTKHGNINAWRAYCKQRGIKYHVITGVDSDHVPRPTFAIRLLGYFRDPDVAFVIAPQGYANATRSIIARGAESQQFPFHSIIQRGGNASRSPMFVGTNYAFREAAMRQVGGLQDSVTEDLATGVSIHAHRNPRTNRHWKSVYTPDVVSDGEGPETWSDYFSQQMRWSRGTYEEWRRDPRRLLALKPRQALFYGLIMNFYPSMAIAWVVGAINSLLYAGLGVRGFIVPPELWLMLFTQSTVLQLGVYFANRRHNVSPYELEGSYGLLGMCMSIFASPFYVAALAASLLRRPARFVVTPKGTSASTDRLMTFRYHLLSAGVFAAAVGLSMYNGLDHPITVVWPLTSLLFCLTPVLIWIEQTHRLRPGEAEKESELLPTAAAPLPVAAQTM
jgi:cellulose synthase/poly-beta-1,6-N-acetylglucosamine synthase-like glycosyltransferase